MLIHMYQRLCYQAYHCNTTFFKEAWTIARSFGKMSSECGPVASAMLRKLTCETNPEHIEVINESYMHNVPKGSETHFKVVVVSKKFEGLPLIKRHRLVNDILKEELNTGVHALSIMAKTPSQWQTSDKVVESSPSCKGGFGK